MGERLQWEALEPIPSIQTRIQHQDGGGRPARASVAAGRGGAREKIEGGAALHRTYMKLMQTS